MTQIIIEKEIDNSLPLVWNKIADFENWPQWFYGLRRITLSSVPVGVGTVRQLTTLTGQSYLEKIVSWEVNKSISFIVLNPPFFANWWKVTISLKEEDNRTVLCWFVDYNMKFGVLGKFIDEILISKIMKALIYRSLNKFIHQLLLM